jgi:predicted 3-demethylubiquinone-9 3-methyltransferase (glyoxalase superfamily)
MAPLMPCLWFDANADDAVEFYLSIFPHSRRLHTAAYGPDGPGPEGSTMVVTFELDRSPFMALNGGPAFSFTPAISFVVRCRDQQQVDHYWDHLLDGGSAMQCGWLTDRFGVSWQIVPDRLEELIAELDEAGAGRVMRAMLAMVKIDIAELEAAADGR